MTDGQPLSPCRAAEDETDSALLEQFVIQREESAFAALVARHGPGVLAVCRRVLRHEQDAEDVSQAAFLVLARKADAVRWEASIKRWLHAVAYRLALGARSAGRRRLSEKPLDSLPEKAHPQEDALAEIGRRELRRVIDDELTCLPEKYRSPVALCYLQGKTNEEAAHQLGWPSGSMSGRLARARALLQQRLLRRGLALILLIAGAAGVLVALRHDGPRETPVAKAMTPFRPVSEGGEGIGGVLQRFPDEQPLEVDRDRLVLMARRTERVANLLHGHAPGEGRREWRRFSLQMRDSARELASALEQREDRSAVRAAQALTASCQKCHAAFRD